MKSYNIVLTGAPCSGKTKAIKEIKKFFENEYNVIIIEETATLLRKLGFKWERMSNYDFQKLVFTVQKTLEKESNNIKNEKTIVLLDRCLLDGKIYSQKNVYEKILAENNLTIDEIGSCYDLIIQLQTVANGLVDLYNFENKYRISNVERAILLEKEEINFFSSFKNYAFIENENDFFIKISKIIELINKKICNEGKK